jgi:pimeloyl-ACP methyl ester carboxylesterase
MLYSLSVCAVDWSRRNFINSMLYRRIEAPRKQHRRSPAMSHEELVLERPGCVLRVRLAGPPGGVLVVMLHGAGLDHHMFDAQLPALTRDYRLALVDARGHGQSRPLVRPFSIADARDDVVAVLDMLGAETSLLLGQSMGGNIAQDVVLHAPARVAALIAVDCACNTLPLNALDRAVLAVSPRLLRLLPERLLWSGTVAVSKYAGVRRYLSATIRQHSKARIIEITTATLRALNPQPDYRTPCPLLIVRGEHDSAGAIRQQAPRWAARDKAQYRVIPRAGHMSNMDNPDAFNAAVLGFLRRHA